MRSRLAGWVGAALAVLLIGAQTVGQWHRAEHAPSASLVVGAAHSDDHAGPTASVFGHAADESAPCRLFDQLTLGDSLMAVAVVLPVFEAVRGCVVPRVERVARSSPTPYQARGPPAFG